MNRLAQDAQWGKGGLAYAAAGHPIGGRRLDRGVVEMTQRWVVRLPKGSNRATRRAEVAKAVREARRERVYLVDVGFSPVNPGGYYYESPVPVEVGDACGDRVTACTAHYARDLRTGQRVAPCYATLCPTTKKEAGL